MATSTTTWVRVHRSGSGAIVVSAISCKLVPGNHALQATTTKRPLWTANSGKPYLLFDGTDDALVSPFIPGSAGTIAIAAKVPASVAATGIMIGGGTTVGNKRCRIVMNISGKPSFDFNTSAIQSGINDYRNADVVAAMTWGGGVVRFYESGLLIAEQSVAANMDGTGSGFALAAIEGGSGTFFAGGIYAALALSRFATPAEIAGITSLFQRTYQ